MLSGSLGLCMYIWRLGLVNRLFFHFRRFSCLRWFWFCTIGYLGAWSTSDVCQFVTQISSTLNSLSMFLCMSLYTTRYKTTNPGMGVFPNEGLNYSACMDILWLRRKVTHKAVYQSGKRLHSFSSLLKIDNVTLVRGRLGLIFDNQVCCISMAHYFTVHTIPIHNAGWVNYLIYLQ